MSMSKWKKLAEIRFYSVTETAIIMGVSMKKVYSWIDAGLLRAYQFGPDNNLIRIRAQELEDFIDLYRAKNGEL